MSQKDKVVSDTARDEAVAAAGTFVPFLLKDYNQTVCGYNFWVMTTCKKQLTWVSGDIVFIPKTTNPFRSLEIVSPAPLTVHKTVQFPTAEREPGSDDGSARLGPNTLYKHTTLVFT